MTKRLLRFLSETLTARVLTNRLLMFTQILLTKGLLWSPSETLRARVLTKRLLRLPSKRHKISTQRIIWLESSHKSHATSLRDSEGKCLDLRAISDQPRYT